MKTFKNENHKSHWYLWNELIKEISRNPLKQTSYTIGEIKEKLSIKLFGIKARSCYACFESHKNGAGCKSCPIFFAHEICIDNATSIYQRLCWRWRLFCGSPSEELLQSIINMMENIRDREWYIFK